MEQSTGSTKLEMKEWEGTGTAITSNSNYLAIGLSNGDIGFWKFSIFKIFDLSIFSMFQNLHYDYVTNMQFIENSNILISGSYDGILSMVNLANKEVLRKYEFSSFLTEVKFCLKNRRF